MKALRVGQVFNYKGLLCQVIRSEIDACCECELCGFCAEKNILSRVGDPCHELCTYPSPKIPCSCTIKLVSKK